jgi:hypothetical protein
MTENRDVSNCHGPMARRNMGLFDGPPGSKFEFYFVGQLRAQHQIDVEIKSAVHHGLFHSLHSDTCLLLSAHERKKSIP